jgi:hypothetical protein
MEQEEHDIATRRRWGIHNIWENSVQHLFLFANNFGVKFVC